jgi:hypothetical protein
MKTRIARFIGLVSLVGAAVVAEPASAQQRDRPAGSKVVRSDQERVFVPIDQARADLSPEERELLQQREAMRQLRSERREAMRSARESGDPQAIARVQEEFRPRMEELRESVRATRDVVMEARLRENPELAARLASREGGRNRSECGGPGQASDQARRRAFRRLQAIAPDGTLTDPAEIPTPLRQELQAHARRVALLQCVRSRARAKGDSETVQRSRIVLRAEHLRHDATVRELLGVPAVVDPTAHAATTNTDDTAQDEVAAPAEESER